MLDPEPTPGPPPDAFASTKRLALLTCLLCEFLQKVFYWERSADALKMSISLKIKLTDFFTIIPLDKR